MTILNDEDVLSIRAGKLARQHLQAHGLKAADVAVVPGAAGGPKAIGLLGLDQAVFPWLNAAPRPREFIGASIGSWRLACALQADPVSQLAHLSERYIDTTYPDPTVHTITRQSAEMLHALFDAEGIEQILNHPQHRLSILVAQSHGLLNRSGRTPLLAGLAFSAGLNLLSRPLLRYAFTRMVCHDVRSSLSFLPADGIPTRLRALDRGNLLPLLLASAAIPGVIEGVRLDDLPGRLLRDGGLIDYHLDLPFDGSRGLTLYPHFTDRIVPGWFDKFLPWRQAHSAHHQHTILIAPSARYLASLPGGKLPDRRDFKRFAGQDTLRQQQWRTAAAQSRQLGDAFLALCDSGRIADIARPLFPDQ
ncbi:patatin-like phospholipase family protein [Paludibacterium sp. B53371]|uniref:patatin-like phospholipase family protein n=1 Tax=Paludibacterium sp. B53371 TaxID=2806263 RepID=UPI001C05D330|nr:patatin-like phospholipase family protein [Paludibacterium sp. B53371]